MTIWNDLINPFREYTFVLPEAKVNYPEQGTVYIAEPCSHRLPLPVLIGVHGSNRSSMDYRDTAFYRAQRDIALSHGYLFASISNGPDTWGLDDGLYNLNQLYQYLPNHFPVSSKVALWATSAGGALANRMVMEYPDQVSFILGTFPVYDLEQAFSLDSCKQAWNTNDFSQFKEKNTGINPANFPALLRNHDYYISHGAADQAVPYAQHTQRMRCDVGANIRVFCIPNGVHGTTDLSYYNELTALAFTKTVKFSG